MRSDKYKIKKEEIDINEEINKEEETPNKLSIFLKNVLKTLIIIIVLFFIYSHFIEPSFINIKEYKLESTNFPESFDGIKIIHFSDIHYGTTFTLNNIDRLIDKINELEPDIIFFTGDFMDKNISISEKDQKNIISKLSKLNPTLNKYAVIGDEDTEKIFTELLSQSNFTILNNEASTLYYKGTTPIEIIGFNKDKNIDYSIINNELDETYPNIYKIVLTHNPNNITEILKYNPNLILSGHTLGGLIKIPKLKPLFIDKNIKYYNRHYFINNTEVFISNGLGTNNIQLRFNNVPSINFYRIYKSF